MPNFAILAIGISQAEKEALGAFNARHKIDIEILDIVLPQDLPEANGRWIKSTLARLYIDLAVSREIDRMLYLDADTMAVAPIDEIFSIDLQGRALGAIDDYVTAFPEKAKRREASLQLKYGPRYFNAGVLLLDWKRCIEGGVFEACRQLLKSCERFESNDQDILNIAFQGNWLALHPRWNVQTGIMPFIPDPAIVHFTGRRKPWERSINWSHTKYARRYMANLAATPWVGFVKKRTILRRAGDALLYIGARIGDIHRVQTARTYFRK